MAQRLAHVLTLAALLLACSGAPPAPTPSPTPSAGPLYLRAWLTQALPPPSLFGWGPMMTVSEGVTIDYNVAVPAIFPGPLVILPNARGVSPAGEQTLIDQARELGLLSGATDFTGGGVAPGGQTGHLLMIVGGERHELIGDPARTVRCEGLRCVADPGTPEAFAVFWRLLSDVSWLESQLGPSRPYTPQRLAILVGPVQPQNDFQPNRLAWPIETSLADFGQPIAGDGDLRCGVVAGDALPALLNALAQANQLSIFVDAAGNERSLTARAMVPAEPSPCDGSEE